MKIIEINNQKEFDNLPNSFNELTIIKIITNDLITVTTRGNSRVEAWGNSRVVARENSSVVAYGNSILRIYSKDSNIKLLDFSIAFMHELNMKLEKSEHSLVQWMGKLNTEIKSIYKINVTTTIEIEETPKGRKFKNI